MTWVVCGCKSDDMSNESKTNSIQQPLRDDEYPFPELRGQNFQSRRWEFINKSNPDSDTRALIKRDSILMNIGLNGESTAGDVRRVALDIRKKFATEEGLNKRDLTALKMALFATGNCVNPAEFMYFILSDFQFDEILILRRSP